MNEKGQVINEKVIVLPLLTILISRAIRITFSCGLSKYQLAKG